MYQNYEKRVKNFIMDMTNPESQIVINDITKNKNISPKDIVDIGNKKPFIFKGYRNENDRIKDTINENRYLFNFPDYEEIKKIKKLKKIKSLSPIKKRNNLTYSKFGIFLKNDSELKNEMKDNQNDLSPDFLNKNKYSFSPLSRNLTKFNKQKYEYYLRNDIILQPLMRFKPRTDLERIYDALNGKYILKDENKIIKRQLKNINLYNYKRANDLLRKIKIKRKNKFNKDNQNNQFDKNNYQRGSISNDLLLQKNKKKKELINTEKNLYYKRNKETDKFKPWIKACDLNIEAGDILKSYHYKTHFKAAEEIAENKHNNLFINRHNNQNMSENIIFNYNDNIYESEQPDEVYNYLESKLNKIPKKHNLIYDDESFKIIKKMAFRKEKSLDQIDDIMKIKEKLMNKKDNKQNPLYDENSFVFDNKIYNKKKEFDLIAKKVLKLCNIYSNKSKFNNSTLKVRNGKTMITRGLSVEQFEKKYGLHE